MTSTSIRPARGPPSVARRCRLETSSDAGAFAFHAAGRFRRGGRCGQLAADLPAARIDVRPSDVPLSCTEVAVGRRARRSLRGASSGVIRRPRRGHVRAVARCRRPPPLTRDAAGVPRRKAAAQQGGALPRRPTDDRGDHCRPARRRRQRPRPSAARPDRRLMAGRTADLRGARARRGRPGRASRIAAGPARQGWPAPRGWHGRLGVEAA
jgi:hypothetical protein